MGLKWSERKIIRNTGTADNRQPDHKFKQKMKLFLGWACFFLFFSRVPLPWRVTPWNLHYIAYSLPHFIIIILSLLWIGGIKYYKFIVSQLREIGWIKSEATMRFSPFPHDYVPWHEPDMLSLPPFWERRHCLASFFLFFLGPVDKMLEKYDNPWHFS